MGQGEQPREQRLVRWRQQHWQQLVQGLRRQLLEGQLQLQLH